MQALKTIWREGGLTALARKASAAVRMTLPRLLLRKRTAASTGAYFDLVTDDSRVFYGDSFHFGYFPTGQETLAEALDAHTDLVASLVELGAGQRVLDVGCGIGAPAVRIAREFGCHVTGVNISREQLRQGREMLEREQMTALVSLEHGDARQLAYPDASFDVVMCVEVAGDICTTAADKHAFVGELFRVLKPGGCLGFSDLALRVVPDREDRNALKAVFYDDGSQLVTDWPAVFAEHGFEVHGDRCIIDQTLPTWDRVREIYTDDGGALAERYGTVIARRVTAQIERIPEVLGRIGTFPVLAARKPAPDAAS